MFILITDSSAHIIDRLESMLLEANDTVTISRALSYDEAITLFKEYQHAVVLIDIGLPGNTAIDLLKEIKITGYKTCVIILFIHIDNNTRKQCKLLGADFFLDKHREFEEIPGIIDSLDLHK